MQFTYPLPHLLELPALTQPWEAAVTGPQQTQAIKRAEAMGFDMISVCEHFVVPREHVELSGAFYFAATAAQGYICGATERVRVGTTITLLPLQHPIVMAKSLSTIDWMCGGRLVAAFGVGWLKEEFDLLGVPFHERGAMADEYLAAIIELWTKEWPEFEGKYVSFKDIAFEPKPAQKPHIPIWMGGDADPALARIAKFGSGWIPFLTPPEKFPEKIDFIKSHPAYTDRGHPFEVSFSLSTMSVGEGHVELDNPHAQLAKNAQEIIDKLNWLADLGVTITNAPIPQVKNIEEHLEMAQWVIEEIKPHVK